METSGTNRDLENRKPVCFELIDKDGKVWGTHPSAEQLCALAKLYFPDQEQDPDRTGRGWDVQVVGS